MEAENVSRSRQILLRTSQFNLSGNVWSEVELAQRAGFKNRGATIFEISDRFGSYGHSGLVVWSVDDKALSIENFVLSCRVLGRGVEKSITRWMLETAEGLGLSQVRFFFTPTVRNRPARNYLSNLIGMTIDNRQDAIAYTAEAETLREACSRERIQEYSDDSLDVKCNRSKKNDEHLLRVSRSDVHRSLDSNIRSIGDILSACNLLNPSSSTRSVLGKRRTLEGILFEAWEELLGPGELKKDVSFFELGGDSLLATRLLSRIRHRLRIELTLVEIFENPELASMEAVLRKRIVEAARAAQAQLIRQ